MIRLGFGRSYSKLFTYSAATFADSAAVLSWTSSTVCSIIFFDFDLVFKSLFAVALANCETSSSASCPL